MSGEARQRIEEMVKGNRVVLFMKGTRAAPQCGFSAAVVDILDDYLEDYATVKAENVAAHEFGHTRGLLHVPYDFNNMMYPEATEPTSVCELELSETQIDTLSGKTSDAKTSPFTYALRSRDHQGSWWDRSILAVRNTVAR